MEIVLLIYLYDFMLVLHVHQDSIFQFSGFQHMKAIDAEEKKEITLLALKFRSIYIKNMNQTNSDHSTMENTSVTNESLMD
jgi:hypothetical protein